MFISPSPTAGKTVKLLPASIKAGQYNDLLTQFSGNEAEMMDWAQKEKVTVSFSPLACIPLDEERLFNVGYLFLQQLCTELRLDNICRNILYLPSGKPAVGEETGGRIRLQRNLKTLRDMNMILLSKDSGCIPSYKRTKLTDALHSAFGFRTDYEFISKADIRALIKETMQKK